MQKKPIFLLFATLLLTSCALFEDHKPHKAIHAKPVKPQKSIDGDVFVQNLSITHLAMETDDGDATAASVSIAKAYEQQKKAKSKTVPLAVIEYKFKSGGGLQKIVTPINATGDYALLQPVMKRLAVMPVTLQNIHVATTIVTPDKSLVLPDDPIQAAAVFEELEAQLSENVTPLATEADIRTQLSLMDFFTRHHCQDAAYLTLDNVKRTLGAATLNKSIDEETLKSLSTMLATRESTLKTDLPYHF